MPQEQPASPTDLCPFWGGQPIPVPAQTRIVGNGQPGVEVQRFVTPCMRESCHFWRILPKGAGGLCALDAGIDSLIELKSKLGKLSLFGG